MSGPAHPDNQHDRPPIAIIANSLPPYRLHFHRRVARELPEVRLFSLFTHETSNAPWRFEEAAEINPVQFGAGESSDQASRPSRAFHEWRKGGRVIRWLSRNHARAVVLLGYNDPGRLRILRWCRGAGVPCFLWGDSNIHGDRAAGLKHLLKRAVVGRILRGCAGVLACGSAGRDYFLRYGADPARVFLSPYEPDYAAIRGLQPEALDRIAREFALPPGRRRMLFSGRFVSVKRPDMVIRAFAAIAAERPEWDLVMIGGGPLLDASRAAVPEAVRGRVKFTGFLDDFKLMAGLYRLSDVLVLPSEYEPWAVVVNEAVAAGLAVVSSDVVGASIELVRDGVNGRLFRSGNQAALDAAALDVTAPRAIDAMKAASTGVLDEWRRRADPVDGLRRALTAVDVIGPRAAPRANRP